MISRCRLLLLAAAGVFLFVPRQSPAQSTEKPIVAVFDVETRGIEMKKATVESLGDYIGSLLSSQGYQVIPRSQLRQRLTEQKTRSYKECYDQACQIELGRELAAQKTLSSQIMKLGSKCKVTLTLFDLRKSASEAGATASGGCGEDDIVASVEKAVSELTGSERRRQEQLSREAREEAGRMAAEEAKRRAQEAERLAPEVRQEGTNLYWRKCLAGKTWKAPGCQGQAKEYPQETAVKSCPPGYRLPTLAELVSLFDDCDDNIRNGRMGSCKPCEKSRVCSEILGKTMSGNFGTWTSTVSRDPNDYGGKNYFRMINSFIFGGLNDSRAWFLDSGTGFGGYAICVRSGS